MSSASALMKLAGIGSNESVAKYAEAMAQNALGSGSDVALPGGEGSQFASFSGNTGALTYGKANAAIPADQVFIIPATSLQHGWLYWASKKPEKDTEVFVNAATSFPPKPDDRLEVGGYAKPRERDGWQRTWQLSMTGYQGLLDGISIEWPGTANGYQQFWSTIVTEFVARVRNMKPGDSAAAVHPVIKIGIGNYWNDTYEKTVYFPTAEFVGWTDGMTILPHTTATLALATETAGDETDPLS
jgi:hypothetical protein